MGEYFDNTYVVADGVILFYEDVDVSLQIPKKMGDMEIHTIGDGAFMESETIEYVSIPYGVKNIGENAFAKCKNLKCINIPGTVREYGRNAFEDCLNLRSIRIYSYEIDEQKYKELKSTWRSANESLYVASCFIDDKRLKDMVRAASAGTANLIPDGISRLYLLKNRDKQKTTAIPKDQDCLGFNNRSPYISEADSLKELVFNPDSAEPDALSEGKNDQFLKSESIPEIEKTAVLTFDDSKTKYENGKYYLLLKIFLGYYFWQSLVPVTFEGKHYYIYRRHFLSSKTNLNYIRNDIKVVTDMGENVGAEEARKVYAKYKLLSIL